MYSLLDIKFYVGKQVTNLLILSYALPLFWGLHKYNSVVFVLSFTCYSLVLPILYLTCQYMYISMHCKGRGTYFKNKYYYQNAFR